MTDLYITYSARERFWVSNLVKALESEGYSIWWEHPVTPGHNVRRESQNALLKAKCALVIWSETAVDDHWVLLDAQQANQQEIIVSAMANECEIPALHQSRGIADMKGWTPKDHQTQQFQDLLEKIQGYCQPSQLPQRLKEQQNKARRERIRAEKARKHNESELVRARMMRKRLAC